MALFDRVRADPVYNTRAVVQRTTVPADTFRAWERRYGLPQPTRTPGNQRLYSDRDVAIIAWLRDQTRAGLTISQAVAMFRAREMEVPMAGAGAMPAAERMAGVRDEVVEALVGYDAARAERAVEEAIALLPVEDVCLHILQPALYEIGHRWERGEVGVSVEHFASGFVLRRLGTLFNLSQPEVGRGPVLAACAEGELHEVGLLLTSLFLSRRGFRVVYLGADLPLRDLIAAVRRVRPPLVLLSASTAETVECLVRAATELRRRCEVGVGDEEPIRPCPRIGYGGHAFLLRPELRERVDGVFLGRDAAEAVTAVDRVLAEAA